MATVPNATVQVPDQDNGFFAGFLEGVAPGSNVVVQEISSAGNSLVNSALNALQNAYYNVKGDLSPAQLQDIAEENAKQVARAGGNAFDQQRVVNETYAAARQVGSHGPVDDLLNTKFKFHFPAVFDLESIFTGHGDGGSGNGSDIDWSSVGWVALIIVGALLIIYSLK